MCPTRTFLLFRTYLRQTVSEQLTVRVDPHVHSEGSYDADDPIELLLEQAAEIGLDAIVVTDHDVIDESLRAADLAPLYGLVGIPGVEVSTADGHLLAVGVESMPPRRRPLAETAAWVRDHGGVAIVPHPFQRSRHGVRRRALVEAGAETTEEDAHPFDAIESYNAWLFTGYKNNRARRFASTFGYPGVAGSDAHSVPFVGRAFTEITIDDATRADLDAELILDAIRDGETAVQGRRQPIPVSTRHYGIGAARKSGHYAKVGALRSAYYAKVGTVRGSRAALTGGLRAVTGAARGVNALFQRMPLSR